MTFEKSKASETQMLIRKPAAAVFEAFIDPAITTNFWFTKGSGRLEVGKQVTWDWEMYNVSSRVTPVEIVQHRKISLDWGRPATRVDFNFEPLTEDTTFVTIRHYGFDKTGDELVEAIKDSSVGFTIVLDGLKAWLEHGIRLNLVADKFPKGKPAR
jgi:uncharacterized protein YndB with AHSA1/START domain